MTEYIIRKLEKEDLTTRVEWFNNPFFYRQMPIKAPIGLAQTESWYANNLTNQTRIDFVMDVAEKPGSFVIVSMAGIVNMSSRDRIAELYILVKPEATRKGIGRFFLTWLCNYGFICCNLHKFMVYTLESNNDARRFYEKSGFIQEGCLKCHFRHHGVWVDRYIHALSRRNWDKQAWSIDCEPSFRGFLE